MQTQFPPKLISFNRFKLTLPLLFSSSQIPNSHLIQHHPIFLLHQSHPDLLTWNSIIAARIHLGSPDSALPLYFRMLSAGSPPNPHTFALLIKACRKLRDSDSAKQGIKVHGQVIKNGALGFLLVKNSLLSMYCDIQLLDDATLLFNETFVLDLISWNVMVSGYGKSGDLKSARYMFDVMPERNLVSWSAMIDGYVRNGGYLEALRLFNMLQCEGLRPDIITLVSILKACGHTGATRQGYWIHLFIERQKFSNLILDTALIDMYCRCGCIDAAFHVFAMVSNKDVVLWNAMIGGLAMHGHGRHALELFGSMKETGMSPNESTYIGVMCACAHAGLVDKGIEIFESMKAQGMEPKREHYGCLVDLMGRGGRIRKAEEVLRSMPMEPHAEQWGALMSACRMHGEFNVGVRVGRRLIELEPQDAGRYVMLANMYANAGRWKEAMDVRREMEEKGMKKERGWSMIEWNGAVELFVAGDRSHRRIGRIYEMIGEMERRLEMLGYVKNTTEMLVDMDGEEEKGVAISYHSEKIAIAFAILNVDEDNLIKIVKNLRVCKDCHNYTKLVSKVYGREIIVRDRNRFHHFKEGICSCKDYW